jgi:hypothetical protein
MEGGWNTDGHRNCGIDVFRRRVPWGFGGGVEPGPQVTLDVMYADWCVHCSDMLAVVEKTVAKMPERSVQVNYWDELLRATDAQTAAVYKMLNAQAFNNCRA